MSASARRLPRISRTSRYQNMLCRYDTMALKSLDVFSVHGFPVGLVQCESNLLGIAGRKGAPVGSGGWLNIVEKFAKAKRYCAQPFEIRHEGSRKVEVLVPGEWIGSFRNGQHPPEEREIQLLCDDSSSAKLGGEKFDAVFTDPPYFGNVQYAELMDFCYVWLRKLLGNSTPEFRKASTRHQNELTGNANMGRGLDHFTDGISKTIQLAAARLKPGHPLAFTYHHNQLDAYFHWPLRSWMPNWSARPHSLPGRDGCFDSYQWHWLVYRGHGLGLSLNRELSAALAC